MGTWSFLGVKCGLGVLLTTHPLLVPWCRKSRAIPLPTLWATLACNRDYFTFYYTCYTVRHKYEWEDIIKMKYGETEHRSMQQYKLAHNTKQMCVAINKATQLHNLQKLVKGK